VGTVQSTPSGLGEILDGMRRPSLIDIDILALRPGTVGAYALALVLVGVATALRLAMDPYIVGVQYVTFFPAVIITTLISGLGAGLFGLVLSVGAAAFFVAHPRFSFGIENLSDLLTTFLFILLTFCNVILIAGMRFAIERYRELNHKMEENSVVLRERLEQYGTALHRSEERLDVVLAELQHRTRNLISVVGTIADSTMRTSETFDDFKSKYRDRLGVLGRAQGLLFRKKEGHRVTFDELIETELSAHSIRVGEDGRVTLDGRKGVRLRSSTVQTLAMVLHELIANAVRYGALKQPNGRLAVRWSREEAVGEGGKPWLHLDWKESGVVMPPSPHRTGQGRELIERALPYQFDARTTFAIEADGVHCTISLPTSEHEVTDSDQPRVA
jgi:two-component sensor histidine kinase